MATPHACPVCKGTGLSAFPVSAFCNQLASCRPCKGTGIVWDRTGDDAPPSVSQPMHPRHFNLPAFEIMR